MGFRLSTAGTGTDAGGEDRPPSASERLLFGGRLRDDHAWSAHDGAFTELGLRAMVLRLPHLLALTARLAHRADARALRMVVGAETGRGVAQAVAMVNLNGVLAALLGGGATTERLRGALPALLTVGLVAVAGAVLKSVSTMGTGRLEPKVERVATELYLRAAQRVEMAAVEDAEFHKRLESARFGAGAARRMIQYATSVINALLSLTAAVAVLTALHPALLPLIVLMTLPSAWAALSVARRNYLSHLAWMQHARAGRMLSDLLTSAQAAAEIRVHGIGGFLLRHFRLMAEDSELEQTRLARLAARTGLVAALGTGAATLAAFGVLGWLLWSGAMALSVGGTAVIALRTGSGALDSLVRQINYLHEEALFVGDLEHVQAEAAARAIPDRGRALPERLDEIRFEKKLAIARARYRDGEILVVDEPTAALDAAAEQEVFAKIRNLAADGQTIVLITHRLHSVRHADLIYLMEHGRTVEHGTFRELMSPSAPGGFRALYELQRSQFQTEEETGRPSLPAQNGPAADGR